MSVAMRRARFRGLLRGGLMAVRRKVMRAIAAFSVVTLSIGLAATVTAHPIDTLQPGQWYRVPNSNLTSVAAQNVPGSFGSIMGAWSGGAFDTTRNRLIIWGGGHSDYGGNEIYAFDVASLTWVRLTEPSTNLGGDEATGYYPDGKPRSFHTYDYIQYVPSIDRFCSFGNSAPYPYATKSTSNIDCFNFDTRQWEPRRGNLPDGAWGTPAVASAYDPTTGHVFVLGMLGSSVLAEFTPLTNTSVVRSSPNYTGYYVTADIDSTRRRFVAIGSGQQFAWNITGSGQATRTTLATTGATEIVNAQAPGLAYDPISDRMVAWSGGADVYTLNLDTNVWTKHAPASTNTVVPTAAAGNGTYGRFRYMPAYNAFIAVNRVTDDVYIYKLTAGPGQPLPAPAPAPSADLTPPTVSLSSPTSGATVSGASVSISASASDNVGISSVQFMLDGQNLGSPDTASPYTLSWNSTQVGNGAHTLAAVARDAAGNQGTAASVTVTVNNQTTSAPTVAPGSSVLLVDFGGTNSTTTFGALGWTTLLRDRYTDHVTAGPGGTAIVVGDNEAYNYQGVSGAPRSFVAGEKIIATWYNNSNASIGFTPRISFDDPNRPVVVTGMPEQGTWYNMTPVSIPPFGTVVSEFAFTTATAGTYALVNVNSNFSNAGTLVCDKIELAAAGTGGLPPSVPPAPSADTTSPTVPTGLTAAALSTSEIALSWNASTDNIGVVGYKIFRNGTQISTTTATAFTSSGLAAGTGYSFTVAAYDAAGNSSGLATSVLQSTQSPPSLPPATPPPSSPPPPSGGGGPVSIPLTIRELLPVGTSGVARTNEPATFGIPLKDADGIQSVAGLGLAGASSYQFKPLSQHPSGNLQWVLVDTLASLSAGGAAQMTLTTGSGSAGGQNLAVDSGATVDVNTGPAQFVIRKSGFNILDLVVTNGTTLVASGHTGGLQFTNGSGAVFSSVNDTPQITVLENGPVKALIKAEGRFKSSGGGNAPMGYTVYLTFYQGMTSVKVGVTLRNAYEAVYARVAFRSFELVLPTALGGTKTFTFPTTRGTFTGTVSGSETAALFQGYTKNKRGPDDYRWPSTYIDIPTDRSTSGTRVTKDATVLKDFVGDDTGDYAVGWGEAKTASSQGVTVAYKDMDAYFPSDIEFAGDGTVRVGLFSKRNPKGTLVFDWATHESRDLLLDFHATAVDNTLVNARLQTPLFGRAAFEQYRDAGAFLGETRLGSYAEQQAVYQANGYRAPSTGASFAITNQARQVYRIWDHSQGGAENQRDAMLANQIDYVRLGYGGQLLNALQRAMFMADQFGRHSDDFDFGAKPNDYFDHVDVSAGPPVNGGYYNHHEDDFEHLWVYGLYTSYYFTGDERYTIGANEASQSLYNRYGSSSDKNVFDRLGISAAREAMLSYRSTREQRYLNKVNSYMVYFLNTILNYPNAPLHGRSLTRGYLISLYEEATQVMYMMIGNTYFPPSIMDILRHTPADHLFSSSAYPGLVYTKEDLEDMLEGLAYFMIREAYNYPSTGRPNIAYGYNTLPGSANPGLRIYDSGLLAAWGFERTGDTQFLSLGARLAANIEEDQTAIANSEPGLLRLIYDVQHQSELRAGLIPIQVSSPSPGTYTLSWTVPADAKHLQIKYSTKSIVANLNYNRATGGFEFDPAQYVPFWAASNLANEPAPATPGTTQTMTVSGLGCGSTCRFAIRYHGDTSATTGTAPSAADSTSPSIPSGVQASAVGTDQITLTWQAASDNVGVTGYRVYENGTLIAQPTGTSYTHAGLVSGATYVYTVAAQDGAGNLSAQSAVTSVTTAGSPPSPAPLPPADTAAPTVPVGLSAGAVSTTQINLSWGASTDNVGVAGYRVLRDGTQIATSTVTTYSASGLVAGTTYSFAVSAFDAAGNISGLSSSVTATTPSATSPPSPIPTGGTPSWQEVPNSKLRSVCPPNNFNGIAYDFLTFCGSVTGAWNSGAFDSNRNRLLVWGGGHNDYYGNELYAFELDTLTMKRITDPAPIAGCTISLAGGTQPNSRHTYDGVAYMANHDRLFVFGGAWACQGGGLTSDTWTLDLATLRWQLMTPAGSIPAAAPGVVTSYDPNSGKVFLHDTSSLYTYDYSSNRFERLSNGGTDYHLSGVIDPVRKKLVLIGNHEAWIYDIGPGSGYTQQPLNTTGGSAIIDSLYPGMAYDPVTDRIVAWNGGDTIYALNLDSKVWTPITASGGPGPAMSNGTYDRWSYSSRSNAFVLVNSVDQNAYLFRLGTSGSTPAGSPPATDATAPSVVTNLQATAVSPSQINVSWNAATDDVGVVGYRLYQNGTQVGTSAGTTYAASGLTAGTTYSFSVSAYDAAGNVSGASASVSATTASAAGTTSPPVPTDTAAPSMPTNLSAVAVSQTQITLTWGASTDNVGVAGYKVFRSGAQVAATSASTFSQTGLTAGTTYSFAVAAYDAAGNTSASSAVASATTLSAPPPPAPSPTTGRVVEIAPSNADTSCNEEFENTANTLQAGDTLVLRGGIYSQTCARVLSNLHGTAQQPILIRAATGEQPVLTRPVRPNGDYDQNNLEIANSSYLTLRGLIFKGGDLGVRLVGTNHHIVIEDSEIAETGNAAFTANSGDTDALTVRHTQIHHTGLFKLGSTEGEGLYLGCNNGTCRVTNSVIEFNYIHDLRGTSSGGNDGIEIKVGSGGNIVRHNVIHTTTLGTAYPCIFVYGGGTTPNTVEGNAMWQCGEAIVALSDAVVQNNIVLQSSSGLASYPHEQVASIRNVTFVNNTVYGHAECASLRWAGAANMLFANNALYCNGTMALYATGLSGAGITVRANLVDGTLVGASLDGTRLLAGGTAGGAFVNPAAMEFWPLAGSPLRGVADPAYLPTSDFNGLPRTIYKDVGAYSTKGLSTNLGWKIVPGFKVLSADSTPPSPPHGLRVR
jgi:chitodextrinase